MESLLEILVPLIFVGIYLFRGLFSGKDEEVEHPSAKREFKELYEETDVSREYAEQQRRVQEEIRRKINARKEPVLEKQEWTTPTIAPATASSSAEDPNDGREVVNKQWGTPEPVHEISPSASQVEPEAFSEGSFSWDASDNIYEQTIAASAQAT